MKCQYNHFGIKPNIIYNSIYCALIKKMLSKNKSEKVPVIIILMPLRQQAQR